MGAKLDWSGALRTLGSGLEDIAAHKREEQLMKLVREQKIADMEEERKYEEEQWKDRHRERTIPAGTETWGLRAPGGMAGAELPSGPQSTMEPFTTRDPAEYRWMMEEIDPLNRRYKEAQIAASEALAADRMRPPAAPRDFTAEHRANRDYDIAHPLPGSGSDKVPDMGGIGSSVDNYDPDLSAALSNAGLLRALKDEAIRIAAQSGVQPEQAVQEAYRALPDDPAVSSEIAGVFPQSLESGGIVRGSPAVVKKFWPDTPATPDTYFSDYLAAHEEVRQELRSIGEKTKPLSVEKLDAIIARAAAKRRLDADSQRALRDEIYRGRVQMPAPQASGATTGETPEQRTIRLLSGGF